MALLKSVNDPIYAELSAVIESGMGRFPGASLDDVELAEVLPLRRGRADRIIDPEAPEEQLFEDANSVHVQIFVDQRPRYFARLERSDAATGEGWRLTRISESAIAKKIEAGIDAVQNDPASDDEVLTLLEVPAYYFVGLLLSGDNGERVLPVEFPRELGVDGSTFYSLEDIRERFRQSAIMGRAPSGDRPEEAQASD